METKTQEEIITKLFEKRFKYKISADGKVIGDLYLTNYNHHLPNSITSVNGGIFLRGYKHPLPNSIVSIRWLHIRVYNYPLPKSIKNVSNIWVDNDYIGLPDNVHEWDKVKKIEYFI